ncbi:MAG: right-handed parallel beta-helix repeat-containing protein [Flavobacteriales bacterium]|nr:right-handed parallel beta-helix repeat-containing protein [Flavobacteriales bacterium]
MSRSFRSILLAALLIAASTASAQLNGSYTVGAAGNYATIAAAITALQTNGVSGPVTMNIISGSYLGNWTLGAVAGTSAVNTVTFQSQALSSAAVTLSNAAALPTLTFNSCTFVRLRYVTVSTTNTGIIFQNAASDITVSDCVFAAASGFSGVNSATVFTGSRIAVENNSFVGGQFAIRLNNSGVSYGADMIVRDNTITGVTNDGILVLRADGLIVERNTISSTGVNTATYNDGISVRNCINELLISRNTVDWSIGSWGIYVDQHTPMPGSPPLIENNMVLVTGGTTAGAVLSVLTTNNAVIRHNSLRSTINKNTLHVQFCTNVVAEGNIHQTMAEECLMLQSATFTSIDRNIYHCTQADMAMQAPSTYYTWSAWQAFGRDANSLFTDPLFVSATDLHLQAGSPAISLAPSPAVTPVDRDGTARPMPVGSTPDIGAHERPEGCTGMSGTYIIGPSVAADYVSFTHAVLAMSSCALTGPVIFLVESGTYTEQITIPDIVGTSATNTITFRSQALDSTVVQLTWPSSTTASNDYTIRLNGVDRIIFDRISIARSGSNNYANVVDYAAVSNAPGSQFTRITHCRLSGTTSASPTNGSLITTSTNAINDSTRIDHCRFERGGYGINWNNFSLGEKLLVEDNVFVDQAHAGARLSITWHAPTFRNNEIQGSLLGARGLEVFGCTNSFTVYNNRIRVDGNALVLSSAGNGGSQPHVLNNTLISTAGSGAVISSGSTNVWFDHNNIQSAVYGVHFGFGTNSITSFRNNVIRSGNYTVYRQTATTSITFASHCALKRSNAGALAYWVSAQNTLASLQSGSGRFASSVVVDPLYFNTTNDLHAYAMELDMAGTPIAFITTDIDGDPRHATTPDIGADEFAPQLWADAFNTCGAADAITSTGSGTDQWVYKDRKVVARFNDNGQNLGTVQLNVFLNNGPVRTSDMGQHYLDRNWHLVTQNAITSSASIRLFFSGSEFTPYAAADPLVTGLGDAGVAHYEGLNENCLETDNPAGQQWTGMYPVTSGTETRVSATGGTNYITPSIGSDGELYVTGQGQVLPVELIAFTGERINERAVELRWTTATEHNNAGFEVWRMIEGEDDFRGIGWVDGAGESQSLISYQLLDDNATGGTIYYKLKQVDHDGGHEWSKVVAVAASTLTSDMVLYPNPCTDQLFIAGGALEGEQVLVLDATGRVVMDLAKLVYGGIDVSALSSGSYSVRMTNPVGRRSARFVKQ